MPYINAAQISGNFGKDAETFHTQSGKSVTRFNIAFTRKWSYKTGQPQQIEIGQRQRNLRSFPRSCDSRSRQ